MELLTAQRLTLPIEGEPAEWLRSVRRAEVRFEDWWHGSPGLDAQLEHMAGKETFPAGPAGNEACSTAIHLRHRAVSGPRGR